MVLLLSVRKFCPFTLDMSEVRTSCNRASLMLFVALNIPSYAFLCFLKQLFLYTMTVQNVISAFLARFMFRRKDQFLNLNLYTIL